ncbi:CRISPR-associated endoribonuclease Cas6 [Actinoalloteichus sp. AHMU CJ021]|uniref:CRISPR-associated protein, Cas6 family n=1 Tax=Actinoalloteichus caeruleus DSM 43889 TaxID=1120930 RepID=A0ABT1JHU8_ACTCY|nr:CRISPR-associated endoribonuclease Cas6 [Actinoalloteichus caeruleus]AUS77484.1 CRISPR-associated endoribonuclease Cas6 [Actinoalloteichus sp. AHMU CJ021]MCP2331346.1 CRISPR-associated protein, Cas6 family [Actinoalloteichus caeruleus DSM 43889]
MRIRVDVDTKAETMHWADVFGPARAVAYTLLRSQNGELARSLHDEGWRGDPMRPFGLTCPQFRGAPRRRGVYTTSDRGAVWFGSPMPEIAGPMAAALHRHDSLRWGRTVLRVREVRVETAEPTAGGEVELTTATPVLVKYDNQFIEPTHPAFLGRLAHNLRHKADVLGLPAPQDLVLVDSGPRRRFLVQGAPRIGAVIRVRLSADPRFVEAIRSWGLGLGNNQGFGWIR